MVFIYISISPHSLFLIVSITRDCNGRTPLHFAAACGHVGILSTLLQAVGSGVHMDNHGYTPLHWACFNGIFLLTKLSIQIILVKCCYCST